MNKVNKNIKNNTRYIILCNYELDHNFNGLLDLKIKEIFFYNDKLYKTKQKALEIINHNNDIIIHMLEKNRLTLNNKMTSLEEIKEKLILTIKEITLDKDYLDSLIFKKGNR